MSSRLPLPKFGEGAWKIAKTFFEGLQSGVNVMGAEGEDFLFLYRDHSFSWYAKFSEKLTFRTPWYTHVRVHIKE